MDAMVRKDDLVSAAELCTRVTTPADPHRSLLCLSQGPAYLRVWAVGYVCSTELSLTALEPGQRGHAFVHAKDFLTRARLLPTSDVRISTDGPRLLLGSPTAPRIFRMPICESEYNPPTHIDDAKVRWTMPAQMLSDMLRAIEAHIGTKASLANGYLQTDHDHLVAVGTDGYRLMLARHRVADPPPSLAIAIPRASVTEIRKFIAKDTAEVIIHATQSTLQLQLDDRRFWTQLSSDPPLRYRDLIPAKTAAISIARDALMDSARAMECAGNALTMQFYGGNSLSITSAGESGSACDELQTSHAETVAPWKIALNARYLLEVLGSLGGKDVRFQTGGDHGPVMIQDTADESMLALIMPIKS